MRARVLGLLILALSVQCAIAQEKETKPTAEELDVTMHVIADPDAKLPDEVIRRIPLPARKPTHSPDSSAAQGQDAAQGGQDRTSEGRELGNEISSSSKERAQEAADQREQARRSQADERRRNPPPPEPPPRPRPNPPRP